jgi:lipopolysaccharide/colanic/teichoic acid biosynthesis glycosyltransferase
LRPPTTVCPSTAPDRLALRIPASPGAPLLAGTVGAPARARRRKRLFDLCFAALVLIATLPLFLLLAAGVRLSSPGPVFFAHQRVGRGGRPFRCWKFRTMVVDADERLERLLRERPDLRAEYAATHKLRDDPRVTVFGRWLRRTSLDELPQFWNVLRGDMSVVGPRPLVDLETARYGEAIATVLGLRPGITGMWQVSGRNDIPYDLRVQIDASYATSHSLRGDLLIVLRTVLVVLRPGRSGAY